jgi:hypothetical protein
MARGEKQTEGGKEEERKRERERERERQERPQSLQCNLESAISLFMPVNFVRTELINPVLDKSSVGTEVVYNKQSYDQSSTQ